MKFFAEETCAFTLFVSHYPSIFKEYENHRACSNHHMSFIANACQSKEEDNINENHKESIIFLYKVVEGIAEKSYGLNVARLAGIDGAIIQKAFQKSEQFSGNIKTLK